MSSKIGVQNIAHTNGTNAMTVSASGVTTFTSPPVGLPASTANSMIDIFTFHNSVSAVQLNNGEVLSSMTRDTTSGVGTLNPGMSESTGLWTFPSTGYYKISYMLNVFSEGSEHNISVLMNFTANNGTSFTEHARDMTAVDSGNGSETMRGTWYLNITNTSNSKFKWTLGLNRGTKFRTGTAGVGSRFYFVKLG